MKTKLEIRHSSVPGGLLEKLAETNLRYTSPVCLYHCVWLWGATFCGVFGDGANGAYEWFCWEAKNGRYALDVSDCGYGSDSIALRDVLLKMEPPQELEKPAPGK